MPIEIERKFLVISDEWKKQVAKTNKIVQGYLSLDPQKAIRIRVEDDNAHINIKSKQSNLRRLEYEYAIPITEAKELLDLCIKPLIKKTRYEVQLDYHTWEIDVFEGDNTGLVVAEIELQTEDELINKPDWIGQDVSDNPAYYNMSLVTKPFSCWRNEM